MASRIPSLRFLLKTPLIGNPYNGYINPYYWVDDHPLLYGNNGSLDPGTHGILRNCESHLMLNLNVHIGSWICIKCLKKVKHILLNSGLMVIHHGTK